MSRSRESKLKDLAKNESIGLIEKNAAAKLARDAFNQYAKSLRSKKVMRRGRGPIFDKEAEKNLKELIQLKNVKLSAHFPTLEAIEDFIQDDSD